MFLKFNSQEERREYGGSGFVELQFCSMPESSSIGSIVNYENIENWKLSSLYVADYFDFEEIYSHIFDCGIYDNLEKGTVDIFGINYYSPSVIDTIISRLEAEKPEAYSILAGWLNEAKNYNGFYILGV